MKIYLGNTGKKEIIELAILSGWGRMVSSLFWRNPIKGLSWALDNGAYSSWLNHTEFEDEKFLSCLDKIPSDSPPDFIVCPDIIAGGLKSLSFSLDWLKELPKKFDYYLAVQDGMTKTDVLPHLHRFSGIFVGGSLCWKLRTGEDWCRLAHSAGLLCHIGRIGTYKNLCFAKFINADSIDSSTFVQCIKKRKLLPIRSFNNQLQLTAFKSIEKIRDEEEGGKRK